MTEATETGAGTVAVLTPRDRADLFEIQDAADAAGGEVWDVVSEDGAVDLTPIREALARAHAALRRIARRREKREQARDRRGSILRD